jgi:hypothetical protein
MYVVQLAYGLPVVNSDASLSLDASGNPLASSNAWTPISSEEKASLLKRQLGISASQAVVSLLKTLGKDMSIENLKETEIDERTIEVRGADVSLPGVITCKKNFYRTPEALEQAWAVNIQFRAHWYNAFVSMTDGKILGATDYVTAAAIPHSHDHDDEEEITFDKLMGNTGKHDHLDASYSGIVNALSGFEIKGGLEKRQAEAGVSLAKYNVYPLDPKKSSFNLASRMEGWHSFDNRLYTTTAGNNVIAQENIQDKANLLENYRPTAANLDFNYVADDSKAPQASVDASITNCFVISNIFHDVVYKYGFTEQAGNFQMRPAGGQGRQGGDDDPVICAVQDSSSSNNANFATGPDGRPGIMRLSNFDRTTPNRDSGLESDIIFHELTHGMTNRLTGGPGNSNCMNSNIARGMGEGWSDSVAIVFRMTPNSQPTDNYVVGGYATNNPAVGIRRYAYSLSTTVNPLTYENVAQSQNSVHAMGTIWATMLNEVYWNIVQKLGFSAQLSDAKSGKGNTVYVSFNWMFLQKL